jgi:serine/threonine-protein kinase
VEGTPFGRYRLVELLGRGGMGEVWRAHDTATNRTVAIKLLPPHLAADDTFVHRFRREAEAAARLNNPHIIPIHNYGEIGGRLYVDMRLIEGRDLQRVLVDGPLEPARAVGIIGQVAKALHAAHKIGLIHRDVKPSNILIDEDDFAYLIDFGIARGADQTGLTGTGSTIGTWQYMAPERMGGHEADARSDIYALACVLYECLTGSRPFPGDNVESQVAAHLTTPPPRPSSTRPDIPADIDAVIAKGMAKKPDERYATTVELARNAHEAVTAPIPRPEPTVAPQPTQPTQPLTRPAGIAENVAEPTRPTIRRTVTPAGTVSPHAATRFRSPSAPPQPPVASPSMSARRPWWRRFVVAAAVAIALIATAVAVVAIVATTRSKPKPTARYQTQTVLPFIGLTDPVGVAVDAESNVYVADYRSRRVLKMSGGGSGPQSELPFSGLNYPDGIAVDREYNVYVTDCYNNRVLKSAGGTGLQVELPFAGLNFPLGVAVDSVGDIYVVDRGNNRVLVMPAGSSTATELPFVGLNGPSWIAVGDGGTVYVTDEGNSRVLMLPNGSGPQTELPFNGLHKPAGVAVGDDGSVYVTDGAGTNQISTAFPSRVLMLPGGKGPQSEVPFNGLNRPLVAAVGHTGTLYVSDNGNRRVLMLPTD